MKKIVFPILLLFFGISCGCKNTAQSGSRSENKKIKELTSTYAVENPLAGYLKAAGYKMNGKSSEIAVPSDEVGFSFKPIYNGIITAITIKIPAVRQDLPVTIWYKESVRKLVNEIVNVSVADKQFTFSIKPLWVIKNNEYIISMNTNSYYGEYKAAGASYPVKVGNILVTNFCYNVGVQKRIPIRNDVNHYKGNVSFNFQKTE